MFLLTKTPGIQTAILLNTIESYFAMVRNENSITWDSRPGGPKVGRITAPQDLDVIQSSFLSQVFLGMGHGWRLGLGYLGVAGLMTGCVSLPESAAEEDKNSDLAPAAEISSPIVPPRYETISLPQATLHLVTIADPVAFPVEVALADELTLVKDLQVAPNCSAETCALAAINAGFFDPNNGLTTSYVVIDGTLVADPRDNERLINNPDLAQYMDQILNRSEFRRYNCEDGPRYDITFHGTPSPEGCTLVDAVGAGPQLLPEHTSETEGFVDTTVSPVRDAIGSRSANARSAIGIKADGSIVLAMVAQKPDVSPAGMTLAELADALADQGVTQALNLDGGSSSTLLFEGTVHYGRLTTGGEPIQRPVKSILWVKDPGQE
jgi:hypothetical protein